MDQGPFKDRIREFFQTEEQERRWLPAYKDHDSRQMANMAHLEAMEDGSFLLFDYKERIPCGKMPGPCGSHMKKHVQAQKEESMRESKKARAERVDAILARLDAEYGTGVPLLSGS